MTAVWARTLPRFRVVKKTGDSALAHHDDREQHQHGSGSDECQCESRCAGAPGGRWIGGGGVGRCGAERHRLLLSSCVTKLSMTGFAKK